MKYLVFWWLLFPAKLFSLNKTLQLSFETSSDLKSLVTTSTSLLEIDTIEVKIKVNNESSITLEFYKSIEISNEYYFHGMSRNGGGSTINLMKQRDITSRNDYFYYGSILDFDSSYIHQIKRNSKGETLVTSLKDYDFPDSLELEHEESFNEEDANTSFSSSNQESSTIIDVMVLWTKRSECANSNQARNCPPTATTKRNMEALCDLAIQETNTAFQLSGVNVTLQLAHTYRDEFYQETSFQDALRHITQPLDGNLDDVYDIRELFGADAVVLFIDNFEFCGNAWIGPSINRMFSILSWSCAVGRFTFAHELGHNFGCFHDRGSSEKCDTEQFYFGYRDPNAEFRDIMAYNCIRGQCDNINGENCPPVQMFSNTLKTYNNKKIGDEKNDCARRINDVRETVASYYSLPTRKPKTPTTEKKHKKQLRKKLKKKQNRLKKKLKKQKKKVKKKLKKKKKNKILTRSPTKLPSRRPSYNPSISPSFIPSPRPSGSQLSTNPPSAKLTQVPSAKPSSAPSMKASILPSEQRYESPSLSTSIEPTMSPPIPPSLAPTSTSPSVGPSTSPSLFPSIIPSIGPSPSPSLLSSKNPSFIPSSLSSIAPSQDPTSTS